MAVQVASEVEKKSATPFLKKGSGWSREGEEQVVFSPLFLSPFSLLLWILTRTEEDGRQDSGRFDESDANSMVAKLKDIVIAGKGCMLRAGSNVEGSMEEAAHILRVALFLHSAEDLPSVLRL